VVSNFKVTWPNGETTPFGLNEERANDGVVLYTPAMGESTHTAGGLELVLERSEAFAPLVVGTSVVARVKSVSPVGNTLLTRDVMVLSVGPNVASRIPKITAGNIVTVSTATSPDLAGTRMAIGGGPTLVEAYKAKQWTVLQPRHPRTAIGWNRSYLFLVEVDGRQNISAGMTLPELADYMANLGCEEAMNLDGGGSATCWMYGNVMNSPSEGRERPAANALVIVQNEKLLSQQKRSSAKH
jgi:hypothetical protein